MTPYTLETSPRRTSAFATLACIYAGVAVLHWAIDLSPWLASILLALTLPAVWDIARNKPSRLVWDSATVTWTTAEQTRSVKIKDVTEIQLITRLDLSIKCTFILTSGDKLRLPPQVTPSREVLQNLGESNGISVKVGHFLSIR